ncbi:MAG: hypothetical protein KDD03_03785 [Gelidibacter sp.]|nr:hypothetical protein [Gelidibacter sp.]
MKKYILLLTFLFLNCIVFAQKPNQKKEKPPTQKELQEMMSEMQMLNDSLSDEERAEMEKMGIKMPDMKNLQKTISTASDAELKKAWEKDTRFVPEKDIARITKAISLNLTNAEIGGFVLKTHQAVLLDLTAETKSKGQLLLQTIKAQKKSIADTSVGLWIEGKTTLALYLMGEALKENPSNTNNLNNYAVMLSMCGAEQLAIPILNNLNKRYPKNSSILNNITQAWLGLGDIDRAEKYADSTIRIAAFHPQANMAKCLIEESKGNIPEAIAAGKKGIKNSFSIEKQTLLQDLGYALKPEDLNWDKPMPQDPMGLEKFVWPEYPKSVEQSMYLEPQWDAFKEVCSQRLDELQSKSEKIEQDWGSIKESRAKLAMKGLPDTQAMPYPLTAIKAMTKLKSLIEPDYGPNMAFIFPEYAESITITTEKLDEIKRIKDTKYKEFNKKYEKQFGEGLPNPYQEACDEENNIRNTYLSTANEILEAANTSYLNIFRRKASDHLYYIQYTMWPEDFERAKINAQIAWLQFISKQQVEFQDKSSYCNGITDKKNASATLQNFDDVACKYESTMNMGIFSITQKCSNLITKWDFAGVKLDMKDNIETNKLNGTVIIGASKGFEGPMATEVTVSGGGIVEFDNSGITDVGVIAGVETSVAGQTIVGAEATITINSGTSVSGKGILQGINN